jgi:ubiquinone/menaquinone biosynthesis C-methylase UbiE
MKKKYEQKNINFLSDSNKGKIGIFILSMSFLFQSCSKEWMANHYNKTAGSPESQPEEIIKILEINKGDTIADIGAGGGYYSFRFAEAVGNTGMVYAVDIEPKYLQIVAEGAQKRKIKNISTIQAQEDSPNLKAGCCDLIFFRNVFHHLAERISYIKKISPSLKTKNSRIVIIDYKKKGGSFFMNFFGHSLPEEKIIQEMNEAGFNLDKDHRILPEQAFLIFKKMSN